MSFPTPVLNAFHRWYHGEGTAEFHAKYGEAAHGTLIMLEPGESHDWRYPLRDIMVECIIDKTRAFADDGTKNNVGGKLRFVIRTGKNSVEARYHPGLVLPGDFPHQGAGTHRGILGGFSGIFEESDWWWFCRCVDKLLEINEAFMAARILAGSSSNPDRTPAQKYLNDDTIVSAGFEQFPPPNPRVAMGSIDEDADSRGVTGLGSNG